MGTLRSYLDLQENDKLLFDELLNEAISKKNLSISWEEVRHQLCLKYRLTEPNEDKVYLLGDSVLGTSFFWSYVFDEYIRCNGGVVEKYKKVCPELSILVVSEK